MQNCRVGRFIAVGRRCCVMIVAAALVSGSVFYSQVFHDFHWVVKRFYIHLDNLIWLHTPLTEVPHYSIFFSPGLSDGDNQFEQMDWDKVKCAACNRSTQRPDLQVKCLSFSCVFLLVLFLVILFVQRWIVCKNLKYFANVPPYCAVGSSCLSSTCIIVLTRHTVIFCLFTGVFVWQYVRCRQGMEQHQVGSTSTHG